MNKEMETCLPGVSRTSGIITRLNEIADCLLFEENEIEAVDICYGQSGVAAFFTLYGQLPGKESYLDLVSNFISNAVEQLNNGYTSEDIANELMDFGMLLEFLAAQSFTETDMNVILGQVDDIAKRDMEGHMEKGNLSHITGALAAGYYYLARVRSNKEVTHHLEKLLNHIDASKITDDQDERNIFWKLEVFNGRTFTGIPHGLSDFIIFFYQLFRLGIQPEKCLELIKGVVGFILKHKYPDCEKFNCHFPNLIGEKRQ